MLLLEDMKRFFRCIELYNTCINWFLEVWNDSSVHRHRGNLVELSAKVYETNQADEVLPDLPAVRLALAS